MSGWGLNIEKFCDQCRDEKSLPRYVGPPLDRAEELDRAVGRHLDRADAAVFDEVWHAPLASRCSRCGGHLSEQWMDGQVRRTNPVSPDGSYRFLKLEIFDPDFLSTANQQMLLAALLDAALRYSPADAANAQLVGSDRHGLYIAAHEGLERPFLDFFQWVNDDGSACAAAAANGTTVMVPNVMRSRLFTDDSRQVMLDARVHAVQSLPLLSSTRQLLGVFSCHYHQAGRPSDDVAPLLNALAKAAAWSLQWQARPIGDGSVAFEESGIGKRVP